MTGPAPAEPRPLRSFHPRRSRISARKRHALDTLFPRYRVEPAGPPLDPATVFGRRAALVLEIGFGMGDATGALAAARPERDHLVVDVHTPGIAHLAELLDAQALTNVRIVNGDAVEVLRDRVPDGAISAVHVFFPDPWPKARHQRRRLIQPAFCELLARKTAVGAELHLATDWEDYATHMVDVLDSCDSFEGGTIPRPAWRPVTKYEEEGRSAGRVVTDLRYTRSAR